MIVGEYEMADVDWFEQSRNPNAVFADLHDHLRRRRVLSLYLNADVNKSLRPSRNIDLDWVRPIYDMQALVKRLNDDTLYYSMRDKGIDLNAAGALVPDRLAFMWSTLVESDGDDDGDLRWMECITAIDHVMVSLRARPNEPPQEGFLAHMFEREQW